MVWDWEVHLRGKHPLDIEMSEERKLGAFRSPFDDKRMKYALRMATYEEAVSLPEEYTELMKYVIIDNQGSVGQCCGAGAKKVKHVAELIQNKRDIEFSMAYLYWRGRNYANPPLSPYIEGSYPLATLKLMLDKGTTTERCAPTDTSSPFDYVECGNADEIAGNFKIDSYHAVPLDPASMKAAIYGITYEQPYKMPDGSPGKCALYVAIPVYESFYSTGKDGIVPLPKDGERLAGGHAVAIVGWKRIDGKFYWIVANSWGAGWGDDGYCYLPEEYSIYEAWMITEGGLSPGPEPEPTPPKLRGFWAGLVEWLITFIKSFFIGGESDTSVIDVNILMQYALGIVLVTLGIYITVTYPAYQLLGAGMVAVGSGLLGINYQKAKMKSVPKTG